MTQQSATACSLDAVWFWDQGVGVFPIATPGKAPACPSWDDYTCSRDEAARFRNYGVRLGKLVVVDTDTPESEAWVAANLPGTPFVVTTARGRHRYYRHDELLPRFIHRDGHSIEVRNHGQYVVGPGSWHQTGIRYTAAEWSWQWNDITAFPTDINWDDRPGASRDRREPLPTNIADGSRNSTLFREACRLRRLGWDEGEIADALAALNRARCRPPLDDAEVREIAQSASRYDPADDTFPLTETGDAEFFVACNADGVRYDHRRGRWLLFAGHVWVPQTDGEIARLAREAIRARQRAAVGDKGRLKWAADGESRRRQTNLCALAQSIKPVADAGDSWDLDPWLLGAPNGIIDLRSGTLRPGRAADRITMRVRSAFDPEATCPLYNQTVAEIFKGDASLIAYFDRYVGYSLTGDCSEESLAFCWGDGANGKGTLMNTIGWLLGDYADDLPFSAFELHSRAGIPNDIAKIVNKRFITASETGEAHRLNEARVKALTGRDPITARFLHKEFFTFQPVAKFWLATNHKPEVRDDSEGFWRRIHLIPFAASFIGREDKTLKDRLRLEAPGILARAVRGCLAWQCEGLNPPAAVRDATTTYRADSMPLMRFLDERCVLDDGACASFTELFRSYVKWCGRDARMGRHEFSVALRQRFKTNENDAQRNRHLPVLFLGVGLVGSEFNLESE